jgi:hypothetical protein
MGIALTNLKQSVKSGDKYNDVHAREKGWRNAEKTKMTRKKMMGIEN